MGWPALFELALLDVPHEGHRSRGPRPLLAEPELLTYDLSIECDTTAERATHEAYILTLILSCDCQSAPQHSKSWHLGLVGHEAVRVAATLMTVAYGPADHAYEVAAAAEGP
jgi:hypothetical protein